MKIRLKVLTPIHIGSGSQITPLEYISITSGRISDKLGDEVGFIDMERLFSDSDFRSDMDRFISTFQNNRYIGDALPQEMLFRNILYKAKVSASARGSNLINIRPFIKSARRIYIPGSSLKGCLLSGVIYKVAKEHNIRTLDDYNRFLGEILGKISVLDNKRFSRWLDVEDSDFKSPEECLEISLVKVTEIDTQREKGIPVLYETLKPEIVFEVNMKTSIDSFKFGKLDPYRILSYADEFYRKVYQKMKYNFNIPHNCFLVRLGQGSSILSTSLLILAEELGLKDYRVPRRNFPSLSPGELPRTQKLINGKIPLGWAALYVEH